MHWATFTVSVLLCVLHMGPKPVQGDLYTSVAMVKQMFRNEKKIISEIEKHLPDKLKASDEYSRFFKYRKNRIANRNLTEMLQSLHHPNAVYLVIKDFAQQYGSLRDSIKGDRDKVKDIKYQHVVTDDTDIMGAINGVLRLQKAYNLDIKDIVNGVYFNITGPLMNYVDAFLIGSFAFKERQFKQSIEWLQMAADMKVAGTHEPDISKDSENITETKIMAILGRALLRENHKEHAEFIYESWRNQDPYDDDFKALARELHQGVSDTNAGQKEEDDPTLCGTNQTKSQSEHDPRMWCRYRGLLPYFRFQEEIISETPYISIVYDVVSNKDNKIIKKLSLTKMSRAVVVAPAGPYISHTRTSQVAFLDDTLSDTILKMSQRVSYITGLDTRVSPTGFLSPSQSSSEPMQVVNYGIGGHFSIHRDPLEYFNAMTRNILTYSGNRLATFLIYLSDVTAGGYTAFPFLDLVFPPMKNSAIMWYNYNPAGDMEQAWHEGCPVAVGDKWIINKWILSYGNMFIRRCGLSKTATQLDIDEDMMRGYKSV